MHRSLVQRVLVLIAAATCVSGALGSAQVKDYDWYTSFRNWMQSSVPGNQRGVDTLTKLYREKLTADGVAPDEIERRLTLLRTKRQEMENDFWNRFFTVDKPKFNTEPNALLASVVEGRKPGTALDVGMGEGRNALFLAKLGWDVTGFDPADKAVALAESRAKELQLKLRTAIALDTDFDFGRERWDLILYSWVGPRDSWQKVIEGLRPGGIVVVEGGSAWFPMNGLLRMFDQLRIVHYEDRVAPSDFFGRNEMPIVRLVAEKPVKK